MHLVQVSESEHNARLALKQHSLCSTIFSGSGTVNIITYSSIGSNQNGAEGASRCGSHCSCAVSVWLTRSIVS